MLNYIHILYIRMLFEKNNPYEYMHIFLRG